MKQLFVTCEIASKLKYIGFDEPCMAWTMVGYDEFVIAPIEKYKTKKRKEQAIKFLLTKVNLNIKNNESLSIKFNGVFNIERQSYYDSEGYFIYSEIEGNIETINKLIELYYEKSNKTT